MMHASVRNARQEESSRIHHGKGWHRRVGDVHVLKVAGSFYEMGEQHGALMREDIPTGPLPYYRSFVEKAMGRSSLGVLSPLIWPAVQRTLGRRVARAIPDFAAETIRGLADGAGMAHQELLDGATMPDSLLWLAARVMQLSGAGPAVAHRLSLGLGCTSAIAWGGATTDGKLMHARNFDYHGVGCWPRTKTVIFHEPDEGQRYVSVAAAGVALGGVTAMNEAGLTLTVHQHMFTDRTALGGTPIGLVGDVIMREANTIDEAQAILESHRPIGCWTYLIADGRAKEVLCFEENPERQVAIRTTEEDETFGYANIYLDPELGATEIDLYGSYWRHNHGRYRRVNELLAKRAGSLDPQGMASILGDTGDPSCRIRDSIAMVLTVGSVVFQPEDGILWMGTGEAPTSRGTFEAFSLSSEDHAPEQGTLTVGALEPAASRDAFEAYRQAYVAYVDDGDAAGARCHLARASELAPEQPIYHAIQGIIALAEGSPAESEEALGRAIALGHPDRERLASFHLWRGRARDLLGRRREAVVDYRTTLGHPADPPVRKAAGKGLRKPYRPKQARRVHVDLSLADVIQP